MNQARGDAREEVLLAAAQAVMSALRRPLERRELPRNATASLRLLETALEAYDPPAS